ncbi:MAG: GNAT family N-acetyltransferase [Promethearchaeota archaeon]
MKKNTLEIPSIEGLYQLTQDDFTPACNMLGDAFHEDPIWCEILKNQEEKFPLVFGVPMKYTLKYGKIFAPTSKLEALAAWLPTPYVDTTFWRLIRSRALFEGMKLGQKIGNQISIVFNQITKDRQNIMKGDYVYLFALGVSPEKQGNGLGTNLVRTFQKNLPNVPIYLETESERNVSFYERLGFEVVNKFQVPMLDLPMWEMVYQP